MASLRKAFSSSSMVTMMEKISARESCKSRSARVSASLTSSSRLMVADIAVLGT